MKKNALILLLVFGLKGISFGQAVLKFQRDSIPATSQFFGDTLFFTDSLRNITTGSLFADSVSLGASVNYNPNNQTSVVSSLNGSLKTIQGGGQIPVSIYIIVKQQEFKTGPNIVIIWPIYKGAPTPRDSVYKRIYVIPTGIEEQIASRIYLYQQGKHILINMGTVENLVKQVRIYNILGDLMVTNSATNSPTISTENWAKGIYICEVIMNNDERKTIEFLLE